MVSSSEAVSEEECDAATAAQATQEEQEQAAAAVAEAARVAAEVGRGGVVGRLKGGDAGCPW